MERWRLELGWGEGACDQEVTYGVRRKIKHDALKYIYNVRMNEEASVREHVLNMMVRFNVVEMNEAVVDEASQRISSWRQSKPGEMTMWFGTGHVISSITMGGL
ncbi:gag/pol protein [Cucumis melo var. makuwa]|uniref:Gag/pol protein n=1 Tax=Cucumis melo var. makuwa TaxID=1194695 RepID=A0A5A7V506_CUCMM|nr:gag/pol protein [Cucumis melo var. makuwa]